MKTFFPIVILFIFLLSPVISSGQAQEEFSIPDKVKYKRHGLKISLGSLINTEENYIGLSFEYAKKNRQSYQFSAGIKGFNGREINLYRGPGLEILNAPRITSGMYLKASTRFYSSSMKPRHFKMNPSIFRGFYMEPEIIIGFYKRNYITYNTSSGFPFSSFVTPELTNKNINYQALMINFGRQGVLEDVLLLDFHLGFGLALDNIHGISDDEYNRNNFNQHGAILKTKKGLSIATNLSIKIGGIF